MNNVNDVNKSSGFQIIKMTFFLISFAFLVTNLFKFGILESGKPPVFYTNIESATFRSLFMFSIPVWLDYLTEFSNSLWSKNRFEVVCCVLCGIYITFISFIGLCFGEQLNGSFFDILTYGAYGAAFIYVFAAVFGNIYILSLRYRSQKNIKKMFSLD